MLSPPVIEALKVVFSPQGSYAQELVVEEMVAAVDAMSKEALGELVSLAAGLLGWRPRLCAAGAWCQRLRLLEPP